MSFDGFDFTDFRVPTPLSSDFTVHPTNTPEEDQTAVQEPEMLNAEMDLTPQALRQDLFIHNGSSSDNEGEGEETSSCCSSTYFRSRSHSIAFFGDTSTYSLPLYSSYEEQQHGETSIHSVHMSHIFDPTAHIHRRPSLSSSPRRSSVCAYPMQTFSSSEPSSPVKKRMSISSSSLFEDIAESSSSPVNIPTSSDEHTCTRSPLYAPERRHSVSASSLDVLRCPYEGCGKMFSRRYNLDTHVRVHTGERPFNCSVCGLSFARNHDLRRHERIHLPEREYSCQACCKSFSRQDALRRHERSNSCANLADLQDHNVEYS